ncbi:MAG: hypothetical protein ACPLRY_01390 [Candidatus Bathyarchaeales archaeon]
MKITALSLLLVITMLVPVLVGFVHFGMFQAPATSASMPKPTVPVFTVKFVNASYSVTSTNPYTGLSETKLINNNSIEVTIKNQPFDYPGYQIYYNIRVKPHFAENWTEIYPVRNMTSSYNGDGTFSYALYINPDSPPQSKSSFTVITFPVVPTQLYGAPDYSYDIQRYYSGAEDQEGCFFAFLSAIPAGGQIDFQVQALVGHSSQRWGVQHPLFPTYGGYFAPAVAYDGASDWSETKTVTIFTSSSSSQTDIPDQETQKTNQNEAIIDAFIIAIALIICLGLSIYLIKRR